jgi:hypothetical protein
MRDDVNGGVTKLCGEQIQKQFDFMEQSSASSGIDYKFVTRFELLDGGNGANTPSVLETWELYGCFVQNINYGDLDYASQDPATITLQLRFDNAVQSPLGDGIGAAVTRTLGQTVTG